LVNKTCTGPVYGEVATECEVCFEFQDRFQIRRGFDSLTSGLVWSSTLIHWTKYRTPLICVLPYFYRCFLHKYCLI